MIIDSHCHLEYEPMCSNLKEVINRAVENNVKYFLSISTTDQSYEKISEKNFVINSNEDKNPLNITKSIEIVYGLRNFIGNANKFAKSEVFIKIITNNEYSEIIIEDDGDGYPSDVLSKIGEPYIKSLKSNAKSKSGLGLGIFIGKTLLEKQGAKVFFLFLQQSKKCLISFI